MSDVQYQPKFVPGDRIVMDQKYHTIIDARFENEEPEYRMGLKGRLKWVPCSDIDAQAEPYNE